MEGMLELGRLECQAFGKTTLSRTGFSLLAFDLGW
jgi:hypothetical protein